MSRVVHGNPELAVLLDVPANNTHSLPHRRWKYALVRIYCSRVLLSLAKHTVDNTRRAEVETTYDAVALIEAQSFGTGVDQASLTELVKEKNLEGLLNLGGVEGITSALETNVKSGIRDDEADIARRSKAFGANTYIKPPSKSLFYFVLQAFKEYPTILILMACSALSIGFGIKEHGLKEGWYDGASTFVAVFIVISVSSLSNLRQSERFDKLRRVNNNIQVDVVRNGRRRLISRFDIVVGDIVVLKIGDQVPADGFFLQGLGHFLQVDESSISDSGNVEVNSNHPFLFSGTKVVDGFAKMLVASVGMNTEWGRRMSSISCHNTEEKTPLQARLNKMTSSLAKIGLVVAFLALLVLLFRYFMGNTTDENRNKAFNGRKTKLNLVVNAIVGIVASAVTVAVVAIPGWLPLAVTLTLNYSRQKMMSDRAMVRRISACETIPSVTVICTDKTGRVTSNQMKVNHFRLGEDDVAEGNYSSIDPPVHELIQEGVALNTTGDVCKSGSDSEYEFFGTATERAILEWVVLNLDMDMEKWRESCTILNVLAFNPDRKRSGILMRRKADNTRHVHWKGAPEIILAKCSAFYDASATRKDFDDISKRKFKEVIEAMASKSLRCIAFAHAELSDSEDERLREEELTWLGVVGIKNPCRDGVKLAVQECRNAKINVKLITGDHSFLARAVATECGILTLDFEHTIEGKTFSEYTDDERLEKVDKIIVMARSTPSDKLLMVKTLKQKGHVVAVSGNDISDAPALKEADISLSMGNHGTEVANESSDIVIWDDNFCAAAKVLRWGRWIYNNNKKFVNIQLTANVVALVINFVAVVIEGEVPLTALNLFWMNMMIYLVGGLALATGKPTRELMETPPVEQTKIPIGNIEWRNQLAIALAQIAVLLTLQFGGNSILGSNAKTTGTLIFNAFVLYQVFNEFHAGIHPLPISQLLPFVSPSN